MHTSTENHPSKQRQSGPVFIVGAPRSGTTMLQYRLRNHPELSLPTGESHFFIPLYDNLASYGDLSQPANIRRVLEAMYEQSRPFLESDLHGMTFNIDTLVDELHAEGRHTMPAIISAIFEKNARGEGKPRWGDKTPYYVTHLPKLLDWFPDAQIIHLIRDGRDVALSLFGRQHDFYVYNTYYAAEYWESYVEKGHALGKALSPEQYMELRYVDLLNHPQDNMRRICDFLGIEYTSGLFEMESVDDPGKTPLVHEPLKANNAGKWRSKMSAAQIKAFESVAGGTLRQFGYELMTEAKPPSWITKAAYRLHNTILTAFRKRLKAKRSD